MKDVVLFGDSYTAGRIPHTNQDGAFAEALGIPLYYRCAVSGSTAQEWALDKNDMLQRVLSCSAADWAVGSLGGNDIFAAAADGIVTDFEKVAMLASLYYVLRLISKRRRTLVMLYPDPFWGTRPDAAAGHRQLIAAIQAVCTEVNCATSNIFTLPLETVLRPTHFDGMDIHPNEDGYVEMAKAVSKIVTL